MSRFGPFEAVGHQAIVDAIRATGAIQPIIISGIDFAGDLSQWEEFRPIDPLDQLAVGWNDFDYAKNLRRSKGDLRRLSVSHPIVVGGFGDTDCDSDYSTKLMKFADRLGISYFAWTWNARPGLRGLFERAARLRPEGQGGTRLSPRAAEAATVAASAPISGRSRPASASEASGLWSDTAWSRFP